jgi:hypothetical protein
VDFHHFSVETAIFRALKPGFSRDKLDVPWDGNVNQRVHGVPQCPIFHMAKEVTDIILTTPHTHIYNIK